MSKTDRTRAIEAQAGWLEQTVETCLARRKHPQLLPRRHRHRNIDRHTEGNMILTKIVRATQPRSLLDECNRESGRLYTQTMVEHWRIYRHQKVWLSRGMDEKYNDFLSPTTLHAHSKPSPKRSRRPTRSAKPGLWMPNFRTK